MDADVEKVSTLRLLMISVFLAKAGDEAWHSKYINNMVCET